MKRKLTSILLMSALLVGGASTFVSCKDYDGDTIGEYTSDLARKIAEQEAALIKLAGDNQALHDQITKDLDKIKQDNSDLANRLTAIEKYASLLQTLSTIQDELENVAKLSGNVDNLNGIDFSKLNTILGYFNNNMLNEVMSNPDKYFGPLKTIIDNGGWGTDFQDVVTKANIISILNELGYTGGGSCSCDLSNYVTKDQILDWALKSELITMDDVKNALAGYYTKSEIDAMISGCVTADQLSAAISGFITGTEAEQKIQDAIKNLVTPEALQNAIDQLTADINKKLDITTFDDFKNTYSSDIQTLTNRLDAIDGEITSLSNRLTIIETLASRVAGQFGFMQQQIDKVNGRIDALVTSVNIDKVSNPIFGSLNLPFGVKSTVLCGIYGENLNGVEFPSTSERADYVNPSERNWSIPEGTPIASFNGVAQTSTGGSVLVTINPNNVDAEGVNLQLVSRDGSAAPAYAPLALQKDYTKITTRGVANGAYRAEAVINANEAYKAKPNIDAAELKEAAKNVFNSIRERKNIGLVSAAKTVYSNFANAIPEYYALNYEWTDGDKVNSTKTDYEIAALTIKPLSFATLYGRGKTITQRIPQLEEILGINLADYQFNWEDLGHVDDMTQSITLEIPDADDITIDGSNIDPEFELDHSKLVVAPKLEKTYDEYGNIKDVVVGEVEVTVNDGFVKIKDMDLGHATVSIGKKDTTITVTVKMDDFNAMIDNINSQVGGMLGTVNDLVDKVQDGFDKINNGVIARLNNVIAKVNKITENPNNLLQPVMLYSDANDGVGRLSESPIAPSLFKLNGQSSGSVNLVPTSYTAELFAPAYKKYIQVNALDGGKASVSSNMLDFKQRAVTLTAEKGKYEIIYSAIDFYGKIATKKYYVEVK
ncbi:MAG: hypothetical protein SO440_04540 [Prevotella sp.]|nr:hypothetical protein [Prevotella sp.]